MKSIVFSNFLHTRVVQLNQRIARKTLGVVVTRVSGHLTTLNMAGGLIDETENINLLPSLELNPVPSFMYKFAIPFTLLSALAIAISYADRANLSTAIIPMATTFHWDSTFSGLVLSAFWAGYALTQVIGGKIADKVGGEVLLIGALLLWSICTGLTPMAAMLGPIPVIIARVLLGVGEGMALPAVHSMIQKYVAPAERSSSAAIVTAACYLGSLLSNYFSPKLIEKFGWESCFQIFSVVPTVVWLPLWLTFMFSFQKLRNLNQEKEIIKPEGAELVSIKESNDQPSVEIFSVPELLKKPPVWAIIAAQYGQSWGMIGLLSWLPTYFSEKFQIPIGELGAFTVLPYLLQLIFSSASGVIADKFIASGTRPIKIRNILQTLGMIVPAICLGLCAWFTQLSAQQSFQLITFGSAMSALTCGAVSCNHFDISPKNAGTIFGIGNTASCIGGLIAVPISGYIFDQTHSWNVIFALFAIHYLLGNILWLKFASDEPLQKQLKTS